MKIFLIILLIILLIFLIYMLMIMPSMNHKKEAEAMRNRFYAHRGLHDNNVNVPENSLAAFAKAVEAGFGMEMDVQLSKDKVPVVFHDTTLQRICGVNGNISDYTFEELQEFRLCGTREKIPAFADVLKLVAGRTPLLVELKSETTDISVAHLADELLSAYKGPYVIESFNPCVLHWYRTMRPGVIRGQLSDAFWKGNEYNHFFHWMLQNLLFNFMSKPDFVAYNCLYPKMASRRICRKFYRNVAAAWTVKSEEQLNEIRNEFDVFIFEGFLPKN